MLLYYFFILVCHLAQIQSTMETAMKMDYEDLFKYVGEFGKYQFLLFLLLSLPSVFIGYQNVMMNFLGAKQTHWCSVPELQNLSREQQRYIAIPKDTDNQYKSCEVYDRNYSEYSYEDFINWNRSVAGEAKETKCSEWVFDQSEFVTTVASQYNLVCDRSILVQLVSTFYIFGMFVGAVTSGAISDRFGRKTTFFAGLVGQIVFAFSAAFAPNYPLFVILRFATNVFVTFAYLSSFVIIIEIIGPKYRVQAGVMYQVGSAIGTMLPSLVAYFVRDARTLQIVMAFPPLASIIGIWLIPESARWLLVRGRESECVDIFRKIAKFNNKPLPENIELKKEETVAQGTLADLFRSRVLRTRTLIIYFTWITTTLIFYGLSLNVGALTGSLFLNNFVSGAVEVPANIICAVTLTIFGRRLPIAFGFIFGCLASFAMIPLLNNKNLSWLLTTLSMLGKASITHCFGGIYVHTAELMPTEVRNVGVGSSATVARIGGMAAPYMGPSLSNIWQPMPSVIFGVMSGLAGIANFFLPETLGRRIPETIADAEAFGKKEKSAASEVISNSYIPPLGEKQEYINKAYEKDDHTKL